MEAWLAWQHQAMQEGYFFGVCNYYVYIARRICGRKAYMKQNVIKHKSNLQTLDEMDFALTVAEVPPPKRIPQASLHNNTPGP
jgi:hypothetical protein